MKIILMRHGEAEDGRDDFSRNLTEKGKSDVKKISRIIQNTGWNVTGLYSSPLVRAKQTAAVLSDNLKISTEAKEDLSPGISSENTADMLSLTSGSDCAVWVFHMPDVSAVASWFTGFPESGFYVSPGSCFALNVPTGSPAGRSVLIYAMQPDFL